MSKPELKPVKPEADPLIEAISTPATPDPFNLETLRLDQNFVERAGVKKLLTKVPVQNPDPQSFIRVHKNYRMALAVIVLKQDNETYLLTPSIAREVPGEFVMVMMRTVITRQGTITPGPSGSQTPMAGSTSGTNQQRTPPSTPKSTGCASSQIRRSGADTNSRSGRCDSAGTHMAGLVVSGTAPHRVPRSPY